MATGGASSARTLRVVTILLAASALLSRLMGYGRDLLLNSLYGATELTDIYRASFTVPDMLNYLLAGGALTVSLLPQMSRVYARLDAAQPAGSPPVTRHPDVDRVFSKIASTLLVAVTIGVIIGEIFTETLVGKIVTGFSAEEIKETARLTRIVLPAQIAFIFGGLVQATLLSRQRFGALALTPLLYNGGIIVGGAIGAYFDAIEGFSWGALIGAVVGALIVPVVVARDQVRFRPQLPSLNKEVRTFLWTAAPLMIGVSLTTVDEWLGVHFGSHLAEGSISWLNSARRLMLVPIGLIGTAAGQATGAYVARLHAEGQRDELAKLLGTSLAAVAALSLVVSAFMMAVPTPIVGLLFEHGRFGPDDTLQTAAALVPLSAGIAAWSAQAVLARALYGVGDTWRPMFATSAVTLAIFPIYSWSARFGIVGLAAAGSLGMLLQVLTLAWLARRRLGLDVRAIGVGVLRAIPVAALAALAAWGVESALVGELHGLGSSLTYGVRLVSSGLAWLLVVAVMGTWLGLPGLQTVKGRLLRRFM
ncbi:MAG: murein biosynthesis integral membrane protein MurJ [Myxococcales bacterium]|nr:murein biosynthesis integral membrane protein MurJ [Myxococcales bacterium]